MGQLPTPKSNFHFIVKILFCARFAYFLHLLTIVPRMDMLAGTELNAAAANHLKQSLASAMNNSSATDPSSIAGNFAEIGAALQALINPLGPLAHQLLPAPNNNAFDPLLIATALLGQQSKSAFTTPPMGGLPQLHQQQQPFPHQMFPNLFLPQAQEGQNSASEEHPKHWQHERSQQSTTGCQATPTLASLLASATCTPQRTQRNGVAKHSPSTSKTQQSPPAKRSRLSLPHKTDSIGCPYGQAEVGIGTSCGAPPFIPRSSVADHPLISGDQPPPLISASSLLSALSNSANFPLTAASPPALPSPLASTAAQKSAQNSPNGAWNRRLSAVSASSTSSGSTATMPGGMQMQLMAQRTPQRKPAAPIPPEKKDQAYYERRRKNNDAAKRSRDTRRMKEEVTAQRAAYLEQENIQLRGQLGVLRAEIAKYQAILLSTTPVTNGISSSNVPLLNNTPVKADQHRMLASPTSTTANEPPIGSGGKATAKSVEGIMIRDSMAADVGNEEGS